MCGMKNESDKCVVESANVTVAEDTPMGYRGGGKTLS